MKTRPAIITSHVRNDTTRKQCNGVMRYNSITMLVEKILDTHYYADFCDALPSEPLAVLDLHSFTIKQCLSQPRPHMTPGGASVHNMADTENSHESGMGGHQEEDNGQEEEDDEEDEDEERKEQLELMASTETDEETVFTALSVDGRATCAYQV